ELGQVSGGAGEGPAGAGQGQEPLGLGADEALQAQAVVQGVAALAAARAAEVEPVQADGAGGGQDGAAGAPLVPGELGAAGAAAARRPFFSAACAWAWRVAWTAWRASARAAGTASASTRARTWPSGAASAVAPSCLARGRACSTSRACKGVPAGEVGGWGMAGPPGLWGRRNNRGGGELPEKIHAHPTSDVGISTVGGIFVHKGTDRPLGQKSTAPIAKEAPCPCRRSPPRRKPSPRSWPTPSARAPTTSSPRSLASSPPPPTPPSSATPNSSSATSPTLSPLAPHSCTCATKNRLPRLRVALPRLRPVRRLPRCP